jgi:hypothetical protein
MGISLCCCAFIIIITGAARRSGGEGEQTNEIKARADTINDHVCNPFSISRLWLTCFYFIFRLFRSSYSPIGFIWESCVCCCRLEFGWWPNSNKAAQPKEEEERG